MKNKIENLIKEVGVNEVESVLKQMKSKVDVKRELKKDFVDLLTGCNISFELLTGCTISFDRDVINYKKDGEWIFYYSKNHNYFYFRYNLWLNFKVKYSLNYQELQELLVDIVEEVLNYKGVTPNTF